MIGYADEYEYLQCSNGWVNDMSDIDDCSGIDCSEDENLFFELAHLSIKTLKNY